MTEVMEPFTALISPTEMRELREDEYWNEELGLICCNLCHKPRQTRLDLFGKEIIA